MKIITPELVNQGFNYESYKKMIDDLLKSNKTTGETQTEEYLEYTKLNVYRTHRIDIKLKLLDVLVDKLIQLKENYIWLVFSEAWCGDAAQNLPILAKMSYVTPNIKFKIVLRDEHKDIMQHYLTNGGMAIPKLICVRESDYEQLFIWGPRPESAQKLIDDNKNAANPISKDEIHAKLHLWYAQNKYLETQQEMHNLIDEFMK